MSRNPLLEAGAISEVWLNGWVFVYELSGCGFESCCCHNSALCKQLIASKQLNGIQRKNSDVHGYQRKEVFINSFVLTYFNYCENNEHNQRQRS